MSAVIKLRTNVRFQLSFHSFTKNRTKIVRIKWTTERWKIAASQCVYACVCAFNRYGICLVNKPFETFIQEIILRDSTLKSVQVDVHLCVCVYINIKHIFILCIFNECMHGRILAMGTHMYFVCGSLETQLNTTNYDLIIISRFDRSVFSPFFLSLSPSRSPFIASTKILLFSISIVCYLFSSSSSSFPFSFHYFALACVRSCLV